MVKLSRFVLKLALIRGCFRSGVSQPRPLAFGLDTRDLITIIAILLPHTLSQSFHCRCTCSGTGLTSFPLVTASLTLPMVHSSILVCVSTHHVPMCGTNTQLGLRMRPSCTLGSSSNTSRPQEATWPESKALTSASSSMTGPRAVLTMTTPFFIFANSAVEMI
jgi:hypothetical protein